MHSLADMQHLHYADHGYTNKRCISFLFVTLVLSHRKWGARIWLLYWVDWGGSHCIFKNIFFNGLAQGMTIWSRLKYLNHNWIDCHEISSKPYCSPEEDVSYRLLVIAYWPFLAPPPSQNVNLSCKNTNEIPPFSAVHSFYCLLANVSMLTPKKQKDYPTNIISA